MVVARFDFFIVGPPKKASVVADLILIIINFTETVCDQYVTPI